MMNGKQLIIYLSVGVVGMIIGTRLTAPDKLIDAALNGIMLAAGMIIGTRLTAKSMRTEIEAMLKESETMQAITKVLTDQTLIKKATEFFEEATELLKSPEVKNVFKNVTELLKQLGGETEKKPLIELPEKPS